MHEVKNTFKPEFLNRIDETIVFSKLTQDDIKKIIDNMLKNVEKRMLEKNIIFDVDEKAKKLIEDKGTDLNYGARPLRRAIQTLIEDKIADEILNGTIVPNKKVTISEKDGEIIVLENKKK
jgi:ATP-dependent Clp protease ATP-binding subunit ClpC